MIAKEFKEVNVYIAENQEEYNTLPAFHNSWEGSMTICFELEPHELISVLETRKIYLKIYTGNGPFPPIHQSCLKKNLIVPPTNVTIIFGLPSSGKTEILRSIAKDTKSLYLKEDDLVDLILQPGAFSHILIDEAVGTDRLKHFVELHEKNFKIVIATQSRVPQELLPTANFVDLPVPPHIISNN